MGHRRGPARPRARAAGIGPQPDPAEDGRARRERPAAARSRGAYREWTSIRRCCRACSSVDEEEVEDPPRAAGARARARAVRPGSGERRRQRRRVEVRALDRRGSEEPPIGVVERIHLPLDQAADRFRQLALDGRQVLGHHWPSCCRTICRRRRSRSRSVMNNGLPSVRLWIVPANQLEAWPGKRNHEDNGNGVLFQHPG